MIVTDALIACPACGARNRLPVVASGRPRCGKCSTHLPWLVDADARQFSAMLDQSSIPVLVDLWAPWCGPCRSIAPILERLAADRVGSLRVVKVNVDEEPTISARLGVQGIPTMVLFHAGEEVGRQVGALPADRIRAWIDSVLTP
ncbi:MAG: thioredoxin [Ilumatobacter sp.]|uniref:thioredoxin n=1 Tax=Ilumatobacter sp. TaxID=1967498 RepID=UPI00329A356F